MPGLAEVLRGFPPVPSRWLDPASVPALAAPERFGEIGSIIVTPLPGHGVPTGALILLRGIDTPGFTDDEEVVARLFATRAGIAMSAARMYDRQASITETLMRELLPPTVHQLAGVDFAARYRPSQDTERVGGDFYDVFPAASHDGESLVVLGDVCGKGIEAALLAGKIRTTMRALLPVAGNHRRLLGLLNTALLNAHNARFATLALASVAREGACVRLRLTCGGHPAPIVIRTGGTAEEAPTCGTLIGALPEIKSTTAEVALAPGEVCVLYTDGITEARGGPFDDEEFGEQRLFEALARVRGDACRSGGRTRADARGPVGQARRARRHGRARHHRTEQGNTSSRSGGTDGAGTPHDRATDRPARHPAPRRAVGGGPARRRAGRHRCRPDRARRRSRPGNGAARRRSVRCSAGSGASGRRTGSPSPRSTPQPRSTSGWSRRCTVG